MRTVKISRRAFLTGLGLASTAALLSACNTVPASSNSGAAPSQPDSEAPASSAASEVPAQPILSVDEFPITDGSTACIPLIAQIMADTTGLDLETARSAVTTNTTAQAWRNLPVRQQLRRFGQAHHRLRGPGIRQGGAEG